MTITKSLNCECGLAGHADQVERFPVGSTVESVRKIDANNFWVPSGALGRITGHTDDGRAWVLFDGYSGGHTFHHPQDHIRLVEAPKALELNLSDQGQMFAGAATIRAAIFDVIDAGCSCESGEKHPWELDENINDPESTEDVVNQQRSRFVDAVIKEIANLQAPPHDGIQIQNLCDHHKREVLPVPTAAVCGMCREGGR